MTTIQVCRTCLAHDTRMFTIANPPLLLLYEKITNSTRNVEDVKPIVVCYICYHLLRKYHRFTESAIKAEHVLQEICKNNIQITEEYMTGIDKTLLFTFQMSPVKVADIEPQNDEKKNVEIKIEFDNDHGKTATAATKKTNPVEINQEDTNQETPINVNIKTETVLEASESDEESELYQDPLHSPNFHYSLEFDDDEPQPSVSIKKEKVLAEKKSVLKKGVKFTKGVRGPQKRKLDQNTRSQKKLEVTTKGDTVEENKDFCLQETGLDRHLGTETCLLNPGTKKCKLEHYTQSPERSEMTSQEEIAAECAPTDLSIAKNLAKVEQSDVGHKKLTYFNEKNKRTKVFMCGYCDHKFPRKQDFTRHLRTHTGEKIFACKFCEKKFIRKISLTVHERTHTGEKPFTCNFCDQKFSSKSYLTRHEKTHTGENLFSCNWCGKTFGQKKYLTVHEKIHQGEKPHACTECGKKFAKKSNLAAHIAYKHTAEKQFSCKDCQKKFINKNDLIRHSRVHTDEKPYTCEYCEKKFSDKYYIKSHLRIHTGEKPYTCNFCPEKFTQKTSLALHVVKHTGHKPFACNQCKKTFSHKCFLTKHLLVHTGERPYKCSYCEKSFLYRSGFRTHIRTHTGEKPYMCNSCGEKFMVRRQLIVHEMAHTGETAFSCSYCEKKFRQKHHLKEHEKIHTSEKPFLCDYCGKGFRRRNYLIVHERSHTGEKPFTCNYCQKRFTRKEYLRDHEKTQHTNEKTSAKKSKQKNDLVILD